MILIELHNFRQMKHPFYQQQSTFVINYLRRVLIFKNNLYPKIIFFAKQLSKMVKLQIFFEYSYIIIYYIIIRHVCRIRRILYFSIEDKGKSFLIFVRSSNNEYRHFGKITYDQNNLKWIKQIKFAFSTTLIFPKNIVLIFSHSLIVSMLIITDTLPHWRHLLTMSYIYEKLL